MSEDSPLHETAETFDSETLDLLATELEVDIETWSPTGTAHRVVIWVVVADGVPYIRSYVGGNARWYREIRGEPHGAIHVADRRIPIRAVPADDAVAVAAYSSAVQIKYAGDPATGAMIRPEVLETTLRLEPDQAP